MHPCKCTVCSVVLVWQSISKLTICFNIEWKFVLWNRVNAATVSCSDIVRSNVSGSLLLSYVTLCKQRILVPDT